MKGLIFRTSCLCVVLLLGAPGGPASAARAQAADLMISLTRPWEGETFYAGPSSLQYNFPVSGWVVSQSHDPRDVEVRLDVIQGQTVVSTLTTQPVADGSFAVYLTVNPEGSQWVFPSELLACADACHYQTELALPPGQVLLHITATDPAGNQVVVERRITIDRADYASVPVQVIVDGAAERSIANIPVKASAWLYMWRARYTLAATDETGLALIRVEALSEAPTQYVVRVEPSVVDGVLYESVQPVAVTLLPGATSTPVLTLHIRGQTGQIVGRLSGITDSVPIRAIHLPDGAYYLTQTTTTGAFAFSDIPIGRYYLVAEAGALAALGLSNEGQILNLANSPQAAVSISTVPLVGTRLQGVVQDKAGAPLPFAWVTLDQTGRGKPVDPDSGSWSFWDVPPQSKTVVVSAPGFYSQAYAFAAAANPNSPLVFNLTQRPETRHLTWGTGEIIVPPESQAAVTDEHIRLDTGWLWGSGQSQRPLTLQTASAVISIQSGTFALERLPGQSTWLYMFEGEADVQTADDAQLGVSVSANSMMILSDNEELIPVPFDAAVAAALHPGSTSPLLPAWEPALGAQLRDRVALMGINAAQFITLITYLMVLVSLFIIPVSGVLWWIKRTRPNGKHSR